VWEQVPYLQEQRDTVAEDEVADEDAQSVVRRRDMAQEGEGVAYREHWDKGVAVGEDSHYCEEDSRT